MIKIHPKNKKTNNSIFGTLLFADLALIELPESSKLNLFSSQKVRPIKLTNRLPLIKTKAIAAGWGWTKPFCEVNASINGKTNQLHFGWVDLMENNLYCINEMEVSFIQQFNKTFGLNIPPCISSWIRKISENNWLDKLCVRPNPASIQYGDSGGPLLVDFVDSWYQIGVVTQGMCNKDKKYISNQNYATFTYIDCEWIKMETNGKTLCF
uniref:Peptidase S1 domain-containing protein n=1 Tax=Meloidogyne hapla TaxID=6305 RepID=A0A1I8BFR8_MELHA